MPSAKSAVYCCFVLAGSDAVDAVELRRSTSPHHAPRPHRVYSFEESDALLEIALAQQRTVSLLADPDVQLVLRKSYSLDDLLVKVPSVYRIRQEAPRGMNGGRVKGRLMTQQRTMSLQADPDVQLVLRNLFAKVPSICRIHQEAPLVGEDKPLKSAYLPTGFSWCSLKWEVLWC